MQPQSSNDLKRRFEQRDELFKLRKDIGKVYLPVQKCGFTPVSKSKFIDVAKGKGGWTFFTNLHTCKSVWSCPVCSFKIRTQRELEISCVLGSALEQGFKMHFLTFTIPHRLGENLKLLQNFVSNTWRKITGTRSYKENRKKHCLTGFIRSLEVTYSDRNGWHPHLHIVYIHKSKDFEDFENLLYELWSRYINKATGKATDKQAFKCIPIYDRKGIEEYITKWNTAKEITQSNNKSGSGLSPFQIFKKFQSLMEINGGELGELAEKYLKLFQEFCFAFKGVRFLTWSRGVKKLFQFEEKSEESICSDEEIETIAFSISKEIFKQLHNNYEHSKLLNSYELNGLVEVENFLLMKYKSRLLKKYAVNDGVYDIKSREMKKFPPFYYLGLK